jgi:membrane protein implicated in regulation of membrane protease activity
VLRSQIARAVGFGAATLGATLLVVGLAGAFAASVPFAAAPFVATAGALGVVLAVAAAVTGASRAASRRGPRPPSP